MSLKSFYGHTFICDGNGKNSFIKFDERINHLSQSKVPYKFVPPLKNIVVGVFIELNN